MLNYLIFKNLDAVYVDENTYYHYIRRKGSTTGSPVSLKFLSWIKHTTIVLNDYKNTTLDIEAYYQYIYSNIVLGNKCLLNLAHGKNPDAEELYELVTSNLNACRIRVLKNKYLSLSNKISGLMLSFMPGLYRFLVILALRIKNR